MDAEGLLVVMVVSVMVMGCVVVAAALVLAVTLARVTLRYLQQFSYPAELALRRGADTDYAERAAADAEAAGRTGGETPPGAEEDAAPDNSGAMRGRPLSEVQEHDDGFRTGPS